MNFKEELMRLLDLEEKPVTNEIYELASAQSKLLSKAGQKVEDISLQIEEIYDIVSENAEAEKSASEAKKRENTLAGGIVVVSDIVENFVSFAREVPEFSEPAGIILSQLDNCLDTCGFVRIGHLGEAVNTKRHVVRGASNSAYPFECVAKVLQSGYEYQGKILRKASVIVSNGQPE